MKSKHERIIDITPSSKGPAIPVPTAAKWVRIILIEGRPATIVKRIELFGEMEIPMAVYLGQIKTNWHFDELKNPVVGLALDVCANGCNLCFAFTAPEDAMDKEGIHSLSLEELKMLFLKYHPTFHVTLEK